MGLFHFGEKLTKKTRNSKNVWKELSQARSQTGSYHII